MSVEILHAFGNPNIGVFIAVSEKWALLPPSAPEKVEQALQRNLGTNVIRTTIGDSSLLGILCVMNSKGIVIGNLVKPDEVSKLRKVIGNELTIEVLNEIKENAIGNLILANDKAAIVSPLIPQDSRLKIADALDTEVVEMTLGGSGLVGAMGVATNRGVLLSPILTDEEAEAVIRTLKVPKGGIGTVNRGNIFVKSGLVANSKGALVGYETTGIEIVRIQSSLF